MAVSAPRSPRAAGGPDGPSSDDEDPEDSDEADDEGNVSISVNQIAKATDCEIMCLASKEFYRVTGPRAVPDLSEAFSRGRFASQAREFGMALGFPLDHRT